MRLCDDKITVFNRRTDEENGWDEYIPTVIQGVSWYSTVRTTVGDKGLLSADTVIVRIPIDADFSGKEYAPPKAYEDSEDISGLFTLANGDIIVMGEVDGSLSPTQIKEQYPDSCIIVGVTDNRRAPNAKHFKVVAT